jgi:hypothetical protein
MQNESNDAENFDAFEILMFNLDVDLEQAERRLKQLKKLNKIKKIKKRIRLLKQEAKTSSNVKSLSNTLMRFTSISERFVEFLMQSQFEEFVASRKRSIRFDKISLYHEKSIKEHRNYVRNLRTTFRLIFEKFLTKNSKIVYVMQFLAKKLKKI